MGQNAIAKTRDWLIDHDNKTIFNVLYIGLALILSIWLGLFWLVAVVSAHGLIEVYRHYILSKRAGLAILESIWEIKLDIGLVLFAFWLAIYLDFIFGLAGLSAGARVATQAGARVAQTGTRIAIWQRVIRGFFLSLDDLGLAFRALMRRKSKNRIQRNTKERSNDITDMEIPTVSTLNPTTSAAVSSSWFKPYSKGDWFSIGFAVVIAISIMISPLMIEKDATDVLDIIQKELRPFPN